MREPLFQGSLSLSLPRKGKFPGRISISVNESGTRKVHLSRILSPQPGRVVKSSVSK